MTHVRRRRRFARTLWALPLLALLSVLAALPLWAQGPQAADTGVQGLQRIDDYLIEVDGKVIPGAEVYQADKSPAILILCSALPSPVLLRPGTQTVETVNLMKVAKQPDGTVNLLPGATLAPQGRFSYGGGDVSFATDGRRVVIKDKPTLLGLQSGAAIKAYSPSTYVQGAKAYRPDASSITALRGTATPVKVKVFFGSWCPHCQHSIPRLLRVEDELKGTKVRFEYFGLPKQGMANVPEFKKLGLKGVPSGIVYVNGREAGRIVDGPSWEAPEVALKSIVAGKKTTAKGR